MNIFNFFSNLFGKPKTIAVWQYICPHCHNVYNNMNAFGNLACPKCSELLNKPYLVYLTIHHNKIVEAKGLY